ncbi:MAG TPA: hypothetical protein VFM46_12150 [Pseudomonadales bacterium]|nr:hypothetical protein [Pseudomonadales bacterium]
MKLGHIVIGLFAFTLGIAQAATNDKQLVDVLYRYTNAKGQLVIDQRLPPEIVPRGYSILSAKTGMVIKVVPASLSEDERKKAAAQREQQAEQKASDEQLLKTYSTVADAERARDRQLEALDVIIGVTQGNIARLNAQFKSEQQRAAEAERAGKEVPTDVIKQMEDDKRQIKDAENFIVQKKAEQEQIKERSAAEIERLKKLLADKEAGRL